MKRDEGTLEVLGLLAEAQALIDRHEYLEARELLLRARAKDSRAMRSGHVAYWLAVVADCLEDYENAIAYIEDALRADALALPYHRSFDIIVDRIRRALASPSRACDDPSTPRLYALLVRSGEADMTSHLAMARYQAHAGQAAEATRLLRAVTTLDPTNRQAWELLLEVARKSGDLDSERLAALELARLGNFGAPIPLFKAKAR